MVAHSPCLAQVCYRMHRIVSKSALKGVGCLMQIRDTYSMVLSAKADYLKEHPELDKERPGGAEVPKQLPSDTDGRSLTRNLTRSRASFK